MNNLLSEAELKEAYEWTDPNHDDILALLDHISAQDARIKELERFGYVRDLETSVRDCNNSRECISHENTKLFGWWQNLKRDNKSLRTRIETLEGELSRLHTIVNDTGRILSVVSSYASNGEPVPDIRVVDQPQVRDPIEIAIDAGTEVQGDV